jgi:hypothetical protein
VRFSDPAASAEDGSKGRFWFVCGALMRMGIAARTIDPRERYCRRSLAVCRIECVVLSYRASDKIAVASVVLFGGVLLPRGGSRCIRSHALEA